MHQTSQTRMRCLRTPKNKRLPSIHPFATRAHSRHTAGRQGTGGSAARRPVTVAEVALDETDPRPVGPDGGRRHGQLTGGSVPVVASCPKRGLGRGGDMRRFFALAASLAAALYLMAAMAAAVGA